MHSLLINDEYVLFLKHYVAMRLMKTCKTFDCNTANTQNAYFTALLCKHIQESP